MENHSNENMPIAPGFHPYFTVAQSEKMNIRTENLPGFEAQTFDWVEHIPDNPYPFPHHVAIRFPGKRNVDNRGEATERSVRPVKYAGLV